MLELVTGGSGSGKSAYAESRICEYNRQAPKPLFYIATMFPYGEETEKKIERHRMLRKGKGFETLEWYTGLKLHLEEGSLQGSDVLLECCRISWQMKCIWNPVQDVMRIKPFWKGSEN